MQTIISKYGRYLAIIVGIALILPIVSIATNQIQIPEAKAEAQLDEQDKQIASDISNMTGVKKEKILKLKEEGKSWNEILEQLKRKNAMGNQAEKDTRTNFLTQDGLGEDAINELRQAGFTDDDIMQTKLLVERVVFQLQDITADVGGQTEVPKPEVQEPSSSINVQQEDISAYRELLNKMHLNTAVYLILKLEQDFGSVEKVLDEYLYALQVGIDLEQYIVDKKQYQQQKQEKSIGIDQQEIITIAKIEETMLQKIQQLNEKEVDVSEINIKGNAATNKPEMPNPLPDVPNPKVEDIMPENPAQQIMNEVKIINPMENE